MVTMIPPYVKDNGSNAESKIFNEIKQIEIYKNTFCLHSLNLSEHEYKTMSEIDFVLICEWGILCLEVKGGNVKREKGVWVFTNRFGNSGVKRESPFEQVKTATFALRNKLRRNPEFKDIKIGYGVIFPDIEFNEVSVEWANEIIYDLKDVDFEKYIYRLIDYWESKKVSINEGLSQELLIKLQNFLRKDFECIKPIRLGISESETQILELTNNQYLALDRMLSNERLFFKGAAGTGKTMLAIEQSRRLAIAGKNVLYLCFNNLLAESVRKHIFDLNLQTNITVYTIHQFFYNTIIQSSLRVSFLNEIAENRVDAFTTIYPEYFIRALTELPPISYDALLIDEAQDILSEKYILPLDKILSGGMNNGNWYFFYDLNNQGKLYNNFSPELYKKLRNYGAAEYTLDLNCRNTKVISMQTSLLSGFTMAETKLENGLPVTYEWFNDINQQTKQIVILTNKLTAAGIKPHEISILYPGDQIELKKHLLNTECLPRLIELKKETYNESLNCIKVCSIQSFKGLENKVIILCGIEKAEGEWINTLNYVGMSRARDALYVFIKSELKSVYLDKLKEFLKI